MKEKIPKDWIDPLKNLARILREEGVKSARWNSQITRAIMLWSITDILFYKANHVPYNQKQLRKLKK